MSEMIERVVAAIYDASCGDAYLGAAFYEASPDVQKAVARAAIAAIEAAGYQIINAEPGPIFGAAEVETRVIPLDKLQIDWDLG